MEVNTTDVQQVVESGVVESDILSLKQNVFSPKNEGPDDTDGGENNVRVSEVTNNLPLIISPNQFFDEKNQDKNLPDTDTSLYNKINTTLQPNEVSDEDDMQTEDVTEHSNVRTSEQPSDMGNNSSDTPTSESDTNDKQKIDTKSKIGCSSNSTQQVGESPIIETDDTLMDSGYMSQYNNYQSFKEICRMSWPKIFKKSQPYLRGCKWSPDGLCCLAIVNDDGMHMIDLPIEYVNGVPKADCPVELLTASFHVKEAGLVYDFCWYPLMMSSKPETCCWITTMKHAPIQMWDAYDGSLRCSYRGFNAVDEMEPALSVKFSQDGNDIIAGYKKELRIFNTSRPGREYYEFKIGSPASCLAQYSTCIAVGSWNGTVTLYDTYRFEPTFVLRNHSGGVTHMQYLYEGRVLATGARKDNKINIWDLRNCSEPLLVLDRVADNNQRIYFDLSPCERYLLSGSTDGAIRSWNWLEENAGFGNLSVINDPAFKFQAHNDCCNSLSIHPERPIVATGSGQHHCEDPTVNMDDDDSEQDTSEQKVPENTLSFWWTSKQG